MPEEICSRCLSIFSKFKSVKKPGHCKKCAGYLNNLDWKRDHPERERELHNRSYRKNFAKRKAYKRLWYEKNVVANRPPRACKENEGKVSTKVSAYEALEKWRKKNPEKFKAIQKRWRDANPEKVKSAVKCYQDKNPHVLKAAMQRRRARIIQALGSFTPDEWKALVVRQQSKCIDCGKKCKLTVGHLIPLSRGGSNSILNIAGQCKSCNSRQHDSIHPDATLSLFDRINPES